MNLLKIGAGIVIGIVVILIGMNQFQSYKLGSRANNAIESIEAKQMLFATMNSTVSSVRSAIVTERQTRLIQNYSSGKDTPYIESISSNEEELFDKVLLYPLKAGTAKGKWSKDGNNYDYHLDSGSITFKYDNQKGTFECLYNCSYFPNY